MIKKFLIKALLASTLFMGGILGVGIVNHIETHNVSNNRSVNIRRSDKPGYEEFSFVITFSKTDSKTNLTKIDYDKNDPSKAALTVIFESLSYSDSKTGDGESVIEATIAMDTSVRFTPGEGYEIDKITTKNTGSGLLGAISGSTLDNVTNKKLENNSNELTPKNKSKQVTVKNFKYQPTYAYIIVVDYHRSDFTEKSDDTYHWDECVCGTTVNKVAHTWGEKQFVSSPTHESAGEAKYTCSCGATKVETTNPNVTDDVAEVRLVNSLTYTGEEQTQEIEVSYLGVKLEEGTDYTVSNNKATERGTHNLTIQGIGFFEGTRTVEYSVAKAPLKVIVESVEVTYGDDEPIYTVDFEGFVNDETVEDLGGELTFECDYEKYSDVGNYSISAIGYTSNNYEITYVDGNLKVNPKEIGLEWSNTEFTFNGENQVPTVAVTGLLNGDVCSAIVSGEQTNVGSYTATATGLDNPNYKLPQEGLETNYTIKAKSISGATITLGDELEYTGTELTQEVESVVLDGVILVEGTDYVVSANKQTNAGTEYELIITGIGNYTGTLTKEFVVAKQKVDIPKANTNLVYIGTEVTGVASSSLYNVVGGTAVNAGTHTATVTLKDTANYEWVSAFDGEVEYSIEKASLTITAESKEVTYGDTVPTYTVSYNGLVNNETKDVLTGTLSIDCEYASTSNVGQYDIIASGLTSDNYEITYGDGKVTVNQKEVGLSWGETQFTYNGNTQLPTVTVTGLVNSDTCTLTVSGEKVNAGTYTATVTALSNSNYKLPTSLTKEFVINKATHDMSGITFNNVTVTYDGSEHELVLGGTLPAGVTVSYTSNKGTNAGTYNVVATFAYDTANYNVIENKTATLTINKATYNMNGISFTDKTVVENKQNQALKINGTLPSGVTVSYSLTECIEPGIYETIASFTGDAANYNTISPMKATLTIKQVELKFESNFEEGHENDVIVSSPEGIDPTKELFVELVELEETDKDLSSFLEKGERIAVAYDVKLLKDGAEVQPDGTLKIKILIPQELRNRNFNIMHIHNDTEKSVLEYEIDGDYVIIHTDKLSEFAFVYKTGSILWAIIVLAVIALFEAGVLVFLILKDKGLLPSKLFAAYPPFIFGMFIPAIQVVLLIVLMVVVVALAVIDILYALKLLKTK